MKTTSLVIILFSLFTQIAFTQDNTISVSSNTASISFPNSIVFKIEANSTSEINSIKLLYGTYEDTCGKVIAFAFPQFAAGKSVNSEWKWDMRQNGGIPPGAKIWWSWEAKDTMGNTLVTNKQEITWSDDVKPWKEIKQGMIRLHYYKGDTRFGNTLLTAAVNALNRLSKDIGIKADQPIDLYVYGNIQDMRDAVLYEPGWTGGLAYSNFNTVIIGITPDDVEWGKRVIAHEFTHVLVGDFTFSCLGFFPTWLVEGIAVYGEGGPEPNGVNFFEKNKLENTLLNFNIVSGDFSEDPDKADLSYSQSYYMVNYLVNKYGKNKLIQFLEMLKTGGELNESMQLTYGVNMTGFEKEWRTSLELSEFKESIIRVTASPTIIPTIIPIQGIESAESNLTKTTNIVIASIIGILAITILIILLFIFKKKQKMRNKS